MQSQNTFFLEINLIKMNCKISLITSKAGIYRGCFMTKCVSSLSDYRPFWHSLVLHVYLYKKKSKILNFNKCFKWWATSICYKNIQFTECISFYITFVHDLYKMIKCQCLRIYSGIKDKDNVFIILKLIWTDTVYQQFAKTKILSY